MMSAFSEGGSRISDGLFYLRGQVRTGKGGGGVKVSKTADATYGRRIGLIADYTLILVFRKV